MKEYFFLKGKDQYGPFTIEQLADKELTNETLIWTDGMESWIMLKDIPELAQKLIPKSVPPPPPSDMELKVSKTEVSGQLKVTTEKKPNPTLEAIKPNKTALTWLIIWCVFHLFALLMSYSQVEIFNDQGDPDTKKFWPFVAFVTTGTHFEETEESKRRGQNWHPRGMFDSRRLDGDWKEDTYFHGLFVEYDWTEFAFYVGSVLVIFILFRLSTKHDPEAISN